MMSHSIPDKSNIPSARWAAVKQLNRIEVGNKFVGHTDVELPDRAVQRGVTEYVAGVTRQKRWLDYLLSQFYRGKLIKLEPILLQILRVGLYDLLFTNTPDYAAISEAVNLAKREVRQGAGGLVNGVLRAITRKRDALPEPAGDLYERLAIRYSHPNWMVKRWLSRFGEGDTRKLLSFNNERPVYAIRVNGLRAEPAGLQMLFEDFEVSFEPSPYLDDFFRVRHLQPILQNKWLDGGLCAVQDESAGLVVRLLDPQPGESILDACAAPGGKTLYAAGRMNGEGQIRAFDVQSERLKLLENVVDVYNAGGIVTWQTADIRTCEVDAQVDRVLVDAPCTGLGVLAKRPDLRWRRSPEALKKAVAMQQEILKGASRFVKPGGVLVYSTCTIEPEENENQVAQFLDKHPDFEIERVDGLAPDEMITPEGFLATLPFRDGTDGAFGAKLRRLAS